MGALPGESEIDNGLLYTRKQRWTGHQRYSSGANVLPCIDNTRFSAATRAGSLKGFCNIG